MMRRARVGEAARKPLCSQYGRFMLRGLRQASSGWVGKTIMGVVVTVLVVSFAIWGIGDIFRGFGRSSLAKVGKTEITIEQFRQIYTDRLQNFSRQIQRPISLEQARALGIDQQIKNQIFSEMLLDERVRTLRLGISDAEIARRVMQDPGFQGPNGQFDRQRFLELIRSVGFTEQRYVADQRRTMLRQQLLGTITGAPIAPTAMVEAVDRFQNEQRTIEYVLFDRAQAGEVTAPAPDVLAKYFEPRKPQFRAPEYRKVVVVALLPAERARSIEISDEDLKRAYEERKVRLATPERRQIQQMVFPKAEDARAASERIAKGETFEAIAQERGLADKDIDLGTVTRAAILDRVVADTAFALKEGEVSAPVQGRFGTVLVRVIKIEPEKVPTFEEAAEQLRTDLANEKAKSEVTAIYDKVEDERSLGKPLTETAEKLKLEARTVEIDRFGRDPKNQPVANLPQQQRLITGAFAADIGTDNDPLQVDGGYVWYEVSGITPERDRTLEEVKDQVEARWREDEIANRLRTKAATFLDKVKGGTALADAAAAENLKVETRAEIKRSSTNPPLTERSLDAIFRTAKDAYGTAQAEQPGEQLVFRVTEVVDPTTDLASEESKRLRGALNNAMAGDVQDEYIQLLQREIGISINERALQQVLSGKNVIDDN
jgi:peptidyl-prolyl cis-trans isomerase D